MSQNEAPPTMDQLKRMSTVERLRESLNHPPPVINDPGYNVDHFNRRKEAVMVAQQRMTHHLITEFTQKEEDRKNAAAEEEDDIGDDDGSHYSSDRSDFKLSTAEVNERPDAKAQRIMEEKYNNFIACLEFCEFHTGFDLNSKACYCPCSSKMKRWRMICGLAKNGGDDQFVCQSSKRNSGPFDANGLVNHCRAKGDAKHLCVQLYLQELYKNHRVFSN